MSTWNIKYRAPRPPLKNRKVDVFIPTYQESIEVIRMTLIGALNIRYPHQTYLLDDGKRNEIKALSEELGVQYIRRPDNLHAKAGNINYALSQTEAEFFFVFDADHIAQQQSLELMIGHLSDPLVAMVQAPQDFYNTNSVEHSPPTKGKEIWHEQTLFYSAILAGRDSLSASSGIGSGALYRREHIDAIGGIPTASVTEDIHTSLRLHNKGYKTAFFNDPIAYGLASTDVNDFYKTRHRWCHGNLQVLSYENFCIGNNLSLKQKITYFLTGVAYLEGWQQLFLALIPIISIAFNMRPFEITVLNIALVLSIPVISLLLLSRINGGYNKMLQNEILSLLRMPAHIISIPGIIRRKIKWNITTKNTNTVFSYAPLAPQIALLAICILSILIGWMKMAHYNFQTGPLFKTTSSLFQQKTPEFESLATISTEVFQGFSVDLFIIAGGCALYTSIKIIALICRAKRCAKESHDHFRFPINLPILSKDQSSQLSLTQWISENQLSSVKPLPKVITLSLPSGPFQVNLTHESGTIYRIDWKDTQQHDVLAMTLYSVDWHRELHHKDITLQNGFTRVWRSLLKKTVIDAQWRSVYCNHSQRLALIELQKSEVILFGEKPNEGDIIQLRIDGDIRTHTLKKAIDLPSLCSINIDGTERYRFSFI